MDNLTNIMEELDEIKSSVPNGSYLKICNETKKCVDKIKDYYLFTYYKNIFKLENGDLEMRPFLQKVVCKLDPECFKEDHVPLLLRDINSYKFFCTFDCDCDKTLYIEDKDENGIPYLSCSNEPKSFVFNRNDDTLSKMDIDQDYQEEPNVFHFKAKEIIPIKLERWLK